MIEIKDKKDCCGCWACENVCPVQCISMDEDNEGFRYPTVDKDKCINCHLCEKVCPIINVEPDKPNHNQRAFLLQHKDKQILHESASGGAFTAIASYVIRKGGVVFGAAYTDNYVVAHQYVEKIEDLWKFRNSKYVQSEMRNAYAQCKEFLKQGRIVCFSGVPCQLEGLLRFLRKPYENLITVDVLCHSITSPKVFRLYVSAQEEKFGREISNIKFRDKTPYGYKYSQMSVYKNGKQVYREGVDTDMYLRSFFSDINVRPSCYDCKFKKQHHLTDFSIWDCFEVYKFSKNLDNDKGVTRLLVNTNKGLQIIESLKEEAMIMEISVEKAVSGVKEMLHSVKKNPKRKAFFSQISDFQQTGGGNPLQEFFPITKRTMAEKYFRTITCKLGLYSIIKRLAKATIKNIKRV